MKYKKLHKLNKMIMEDYEDYPFMKNQDTKEQFYIFSKDNHKHLYLSSVIYVDFDIHGFLAQSITKANFIHLTEEKDYLDLFDLLLEYDEGCAESIDAEAVEVVDLLNKVYYHNSSDGEFISITGEIE